MALIPGQRGHDIGTGIARAMMMLGAMGKPRMQAGLLNQFQQEAEQRQQAGRYQGLLHSFSEQNTDFPEHSARTNPPLLSAAPNDRGILHAPEPAPAPGMSGGNVGILANPQLGMLTPQQIAVLRALPPDVGQRMIAKQAFAQPPERRIIKGADGFNYYADTGERVLPDVKRPPTDKGFTLGGGQARYDSQGNLIAERKKAANPAFVTLTPDEVRQAGFRPGTIVQRDPETGRLHTVQSPTEGQAVRTANGRATLRAQGAIRSYAAGLFGGTYNPVTGDFSGLNPEQMRQVVELARRATDALEGGTGTNIPAFIEQALGQMRGGNESPGRTPPPGKTGQQSQPIDIGKWGTTNPQAVKRRLVKGKTYRLPNGNIATWNGTEFEVQ